MVCPPDGPGTEVCKNPGGDLQIAIFSVGSGDAALIIFPNGKTMMVDSGPSSKFRDRVLPFLQRSGITHLDYYFETHDYQRAIKHYRAQVRETGDSPRLHKKIISAQYNIGIAHIKAHHYERALEYMEAVLEADPHNERARHKAAKLKLAIDRRRKRRVEHTKQD